MKRNVKARQSRVLGAQALANVTGGDNGVIHMQGISGGAAPDAIVGGGKPNGVNGGGHP